MILRPGKTPTGQEIRGYLHRLVWRIRTRRALDRKPVLRGFTETQYAAKSWTIERRACARIEATALGLDIRFVVTNIAKGSPEHIHDVIYCARGQAENLIKMHKSQIACDRTSCRSPIANQVRLVLHSAACWLILTVRDAIPKAHAMAKAEFATIRLRLLKPGARVIETISRVRLAFAAACPEADLFRQIAITLQPAGPWPTGPSRPAEPPPQPSTHSTNSTPAAVQKTPRSCTQPSRVTNAAGPHE